MVDIDEPDARTLGGKIHARRYFRLLVTVDSGSDNTITLKTPVERVAWSVGNSPSLTWAFARTALSADRKTITVHAVVAAGDPRYGYIHVWT